MLVLGIALLPVLLLLLYIYRKDNASPEPPLQLAKAFFYGVVSIFVSLFFTSTLFSLPLFDFKESNTVFGQFAEAFFGAALPEESAKLLMLWLLLRKNKYYDEYFDGIVYATFVGLGFAAFENVMYVAQAGGDWISVGFSRALFSIPGHFSFAVAMGYFYSLVHFGQKTNSLMQACVLLVPVIAHWIYDGLLFAQGVVAEMVGLVFILCFLVFVVIMYRRTIKLVAKLRDFDNPPPLPQSPQMPPPPPPTNRV
ncbi:MAG: PrsW family intramembrane metalloprotease [Bacteroidaceae bacterium]|nr:PrsW family intramembrane metalloprotease [Bacteroidaceae bacterium]